MLPSLSDLCRISLRTVPTKTSTTEASGSATSWTRPTAKIHPLSSKPKFVKVNWVNEKISRRRKIVSKTFKEFPMETKKDKVKIKNEYWQLHLSKYALNLIKFENWSLRKSAFHCCISFQNKLDGKNHTFSAHNGISQFFSRSIKQSSVKNVWFWLTAAAAEQMYKNQFLQSKKIHF